MQQAATKAHPDITAKNHLHLPTIDPQNHQKYSNNLYRFLKKRDPEWVASCQVYRDQDQMLWIGVMEHGWFSACTLLGVLCLGAAERTGSYALQRFTKIEEVKGFWEEYMRVGRCAIDPKHQRAFLEDESRWLMSKDQTTRSCLWCGEVKQRLVIEEEMIEHRKWVEI
ncbi:hypothetical protein [Acidithiobacillus albertensis]|uniref:hypothetical protein n=1 Tax=Acidithiobacillus albertensis TaxID=119978 RepID=UPI00094AE8E9|nr:hypothetical protein [Acidithiobacillus albertensis]